MKVKDVLAEVVKQLGIDGIKINTALDTPATDSRILKLINAINVVYFQLITEQSTLEREDKVIFQNGKLELSSLPEKLCDVISVADVSGNVKFRLTSTAILADIEDGKVAVLRYCYIPAEYLTLSTDFEISPKITIHLFAKGVAAEYAMETMMYEEAVLFDKRYKEGLQSVLSAKGERTLFVRRWL